MFAGADSIAGVIVLRHGGMPQLFTGVRAPSRLGTFLRCLPFGHVRQLDAGVARFTAGLAWHASIIDTAEGGVLPRDRRYDPCDVRQCQAGRRLWLLRRETAQRAAVDRVERVLGAGDRRHATAEGLGQLCPRRGTPGRRRARCTSCSEVRSSGMPPIRCRPVSTGGR